MSDVGAEVERLHRLLADWLGADCDAAVLTEFRDSHAEDFTLITTEGAVLTAEELFTALAGARNSAPGLAIGVDEIAIVAESPEFTVVRFREAHRRDGTSTVRRTTAVLRRTPGGLRWQHVHETAA
ncbi:DUF4440 domain-containing protein [Saccharopolyspora indica]|uniref:DUF4440 domain-containing protein n=1 Tax=Saccharopolyspora indica TaxID=1229659 RepID=UPI0022EA2663|nr:DUF4440 domain-containing protein [Saccharopolyspora indica]MDA3648738.1 DUF4440 domain-containing protein [Saccharopolyspora indica]